MSKKPIISDLEIEQAWSCMPNQGDFSLGLLFREVPDEVYENFLGKKFNDVERSGDSFLQPHSVLNYMTGEEASYYIAVYLLHLAEMLKNSTVSGFNLFPLEELFYFLNRRKILRKTLLPFLNKTQIKLIIKSMDGLEQIFNANDSPYIGDNCSQRLRDSRIFLTEQLGN